MIWFWFSVAGWIVANDGKVLIVDDENNILNAMERLLTEHGIPVLRASGGEEALQVLNEMVVAVIVTDNLMPGMRGLELLARMTAISPDTVKILMTAYADLRTAVDAINRGEVFRFIVKPWDNAEMVRAVEDARKRYDVIITLKNGDEATIRSLAQAIELKDFYTRGHSERVAWYAVRIAELLGLSEEMKKEIRYGSWLHDCGKIGVPEVILTSPYGLSEQEFETVKGHPVWGAEVARQARLSQVVVNIILHHHERYDGSGYPMGLSGEDIPLEARIVTIADIYDALTSQRHYQPASSPRETADILRGMKGQKLDPRLVELFLGSLGKGVEECGP